MKKLKKAAYFALAAFLAIAGNMLVAQTQNAWGEVLLLGIGIVALVLFCKALNQQEPGAHHALFEFVGMPICLGIWGAATMNTNSASWHFVGSLALGYVLLEFASVIRIMDFDTIDYRY